MSAELDRIVESLLFLSPDPVNAAALADACEVDEDEVVATPGALTRGVQLTGPRARAA